MNNNQSRSNNSICEISINLITNIVRVSYISAANIGFITQAPSPSLARATRNPAPSSSPQYPRNLRSQEPTVSYLMHPSDTNGSNMSMIKDDENVDQKASNFIKKVHARNMKDANERSNFDEFIIPPPPPPHNMLQSSSSY
ncbi:hypothetical protein R6Q57_022796 [Mikania cordata]